MNASKHLARLLSEYGADVIPTDLEQTIVRSGVRPRSAERLLVGSAVAECVAHAPSHHARVLLLDAHADWLVEVSTGVEVA